MREQQSLTCAIENDNRPRPMLSLLAGGSRLLCRQHKLGRRFGKEEVRSRTRGLLRVPTPQEGGWFGPRHSEDALANWGTGRQS